MRFALPLTAALAIAAAASLFTDRPGWALLLGLLGLVGAGFLVAEMLEDLGSDD